MEQVRTKFQFGNIKGVTWKFSRFFGGRFVVTRMYETRSVWKYIIIPLRAAVVTATNLPLRI